jgi:lipopolysaccharide transport protein LptA
MSLFPVLPCPAQEDGSISSPIQIEADRMESVQEKNVITFSGHVEAKQDDLIIHADQMTVNYILNPANSLVPAAPRKLIK